MSPRWRPCDMSSHINTRDLVAREVGGSSFSQAEKQLIASQFKFIEDTVAAALKRPDHDPAGSISPWVADKIQETCRDAIRALTGEWGPGYRPSEIRMLGAQAAWEGRSSIWCPYNENAED